MTDPISRPQRADAVRSRLAIVDAATNLFAAEGSRVALDRVAERAGVGSATLHRHFAGRPELLAAVVARVVERFADSGRTELESSEDGDALWRWLNVVLRHCALDRSIVDAAGTAAVGWDRLLEVGQPLLDRARAFGTVHPGVEVVDLLRLVNAIAPVAGGDADEAERLFRMVRRGLERRFEAPHHPGEKSWG